MFFGIGGSILLFLGGVVLVVVTLIRRASWNSAQKPTGAATFA